MTDYLEQVQRQKTLSRSVYVTTARFLHDPRPFPLPHNEVQHREGDDIVFSLAMVHNNLEERGFVSWPSPSSCHLFFHIPCSSTEFYSSHVQSISITYTGQANSVAVFGTFNNVESLSTLLLLLTLSSPVR